MNVFILNITGDFPRLSEMRYKVDPHDKIHCLHYFRIKGQSFFDQLQEIFPDTTLTFHEMQKYTLAGAIKRVRKLIIDEYNDGGSISIYLAGGTQMTTIVTLLSCFLEYDKITDLFYITEENILVKLPILQWRISRTKQQILGFFTLGPDLVKNLAGKLGISQVMAYKHLKDLVNEGYLKKTMHSYALTPMGWMVAVPIFLLPEVDRKKFQL